MAGLMLGVGIGGIFVCFLRAITIAIWPISSDPSDTDHEFKSVLAFSIICMGINLLCGMAQLHLAENEFCIYHLWKNPGFRIAWQDSERDASTSGIRLSNTATQVERDETWGSLMTIIGHNLRDTKGLLYSLIFVNWLTFTLAPGTVGDTFWTWLVKLQW